MMSSQRGFDQLSGSSLWSHHRRIVAGAHSVGGEVAADVPRRAEVAMLELEQTLTVLRYQSSVLLVTRYLLLVALSFRRL